MKFPGIRSAEMKKFFRFPVDEFHLEIKVLFREEADL